MVMQGFLFTFQAVQAVQEPINTEFGCALTAKMGTVQTQPVTGVLESLLILVGG